MCCIVVLYCLGCRMTWPICVCLHEPQYHLKEILLVLELSFQCFTNMIEEVETNKISLLLSCHFTVNTLLNPLPVHASKLLQDMALLGPCFNVPKSSKEALLVPLSPSLTLVSYSGKIAALCTVFPPKYSGIKSNRIYCI